jgi:phage tail sheath protein FI
MSIPHTFPGVFIEEIPSGVRAITGVPTAIAAFVGRTLQGPADQPVIVNSFGDFARIFGGLDADSSVSYAVRDFFQNGGGQAIVVRIFRPHGTEDGFARVTIGTGPSQFVLRAADPGPWANDLSIQISVIDPGFVLAVTPDSPPVPKAQAQNAQLATVATLLGLDVPVPADYRTNLKTIFNLRITSGGTSETIANVTLGQSPRQLSQVLKVGDTESQFVVWDPANALPTPTPPSGPPITDVVANGQDTFPTTPPVVFKVGTAVSKGDALQTTDYFPNPPAGADSPKTGVLALDNTDIFNILCLPPDQRSAADPVSWGDTPTNVFVPALNYCVGRRAMLVVDPPTSMTVPSQGQSTLNDLAVAGISGDAARNSVMYFPRVREIDPLNGNKVGTFVSCGIVSGIMARTDAARGVWKAPAGIDASISGTTGLAVNMTDAENGELNPIGINALRTFPIIGSVVWGARTLRGADVIADDYKYLPVRRFALFLEESLFRGLKFAVFEPNDEPLWAQIRLNVGAFLNNLFRQGAFQGRTPADAYFVKCDNETTTQNDINLGVVNVLVGFAPLKPAEFVIVRIQQIAGQVTT